MLWLQEGTFSKRNLCMMVIPMCVLLSQHGTGKHLPSALTSCSSSKLENWPFCFSCTISCPINCQYIILPAPSTSPPVKTKLKHSLLCFLQRVFASLRLPSCACNKRSLFLSFFLFSPFVSFSPWRIKQYIKWFCLSRWQRQNWWGRHLEVCTLALLLIGSVNLNKFLKTLLSCSKSFETYLFLCI